MRAVALAALVSLSMALASTGRASADDAPAPAAAAPEWRHATSLTGEPRYADGFKHFDYVNPDAPKDGSVRLAVSGGFDTFNPILPKGNPAPGSGLLYESLMEPSLDELNISASYALIAEATRFPDDFSWVEFRLNPKAKWHDGQAITAEDVVWSFQKATELDPRMGFYYHDVKKAEVVGDGIVRFTFDGPNNRELPKIMGQLTILPKHWWEGTDAKGQKRDISRSTLEPPLGSGPYKIDSASNGRWISYKRVADYWGQDLPARVGTNNFDEVRFDSYLDDAVELEAFKGGQYDFRNERSSNRWATSYKFPAVAEGKVVLQEFPDRATGVMQGYVPNLRLDKFKDPRVRQALNYAYDFETTNKNVSAGLLKRIGSYFAGTELAASGLPQGRELELLESVRNQVPPEVFTTPYTNPIGGDPKNVRENLRKAVALLKEAGYDFSGKRLVKAGTQDQFTIEFLYYDKSAERSLLPYVRNLESIGIKANLRLVDQPQYLSRINNRDFEVATLAWGQSLSPGNEQRDYWGSASADRQESRNYGGIKNPAVDKLIDAIIFAKSREDLVAATHALDRVLLWNYYVVPQFYSDVDRTARWDRFGHPEKMPEYSLAFPTIWWWDQAKAEKVGPRP